MMRTLDGQVFEELRDRGSGRTYEGLQLRRCYFQGCFTVVSKPKQRVTFRDVHLIDCEERGCTLRGAVLDQCTVSGLKTNGLFQTWAAVFRHVTMKGRLGRFMMSGAIGITEDAVKEQEAFGEANSAFYADVDWALDIREAEFEECDLRGIPARLVLRDSESQVVVSRERALAGAWRALDLSRTHWGTALELFLQRGRPDVVFVAPKRNRDYPDLLAGLRTLRAAGVAEPE